MSGPRSKLTQENGHGRWLLGAFVVAWLNLAVQPCLMAMEAGGDPANDAIHVTHSDHASHSSDHGCDHCPPASHDHVTPCATSLSAGCSSVTQGSNDGRNGPAKPKDLPASAAIAEPAPPIDFIVSSESPPAPDRVALKFTSEPPLNIQYCVFLK